jgi:hypothetical protein
MSYFDNLDNEPLNKYKINLKNGIFFIDVFFYVQIYDHSNFMQFYYHLIVHQGPLNWNRCKLHENLIVFDELSNDNEIAWNLNDHQSNDRITHL